MRTGHWLPTRPRSSGRGARSQASWPPTPKLRDVVADKLDDDRPPQQISQWLRREFRGDAATGESPMNRSIVTCICRRGKCLTPVCLTVCGSQRPIGRPRGKKRSHGRGQIEHGLHPRPSARGRWAPVPGHWQSQWCCQAAWASAAGARSRSVRRAAVPTRLDAVAGQGSDGLAVGAASGALFQVESRLGPARIMLVCADR